MKFHLEIKRFLISRAVTFWNSLAGEMEANKFNHNEAWTVYKRDYMTQSSEYCGTETDDLGSSFSERCSWLWRLLPCSHNTFLQLVLWSLPWRIPGRKPPSTLLRCPIFTAAKVHFKMIRCVTSIWCYFFMQAVGRDGAGLEASITAREQL